MAKILLSDIALTRSPFEAGDRVLVRVHDRLHSDQIKNIKRAIDKLAGCEIRTIVINELDIRITARRGEEFVILAGPEKMAGTFDNTPGVATMGTSIVDLLPGDRLEVALLSGRPIPAQAKDYLKHWAGEGVVIHYIESTPHE